MSELDTIEIFNPTTEDWTWNYNGEPYTVKAEETKHFARYVGLHLAKHLSTKMIEQEVLDKTPQAEKDAALIQQNSRLNSRLAQLAVYDTHERRIALYKILRSRDLVTDVIKGYPFKGFIGEMNTFEEFVRSEEAVATGLKEGKTFDEIIEAKKAAREAAKAKATIPASA